MTDFSPKTGTTALQIVDTVEAIIAEATLAEKVGMMSGKGFFRSEERRVGKEC